MSLHWLVIAEPKDREATDARPGKGWTRHASSAVEALSTITVPPGYEVVHVESKETPFVIDAPSTLYVPRPN